MIPKEQIEVEMPRKTEDVFDPNNINRTQHTEFRNISYIGE
jgi:hypothetical protein